MHHAYLAYLSTGINTMLAFIAASIDKITPAHTNRIIGVARDVGDIVEASERCGVGLDVEVFVLNTATVQLKFLEVMVVAATICAHSCETHIVFKPVNSAHPTIMIFANKT